VHYLKLLAQARHGCTYFRAIEQAQAHHIEDQRATKTSALLGIVFGTLR